MIKNDKKCKIMQKNVPLRNFERQGSDLIPFWSMALKTFGEKRLKKMQVSWNKFARRVKSARQLRSDVTGCASLITGVREDVI